MRVLVTGATGLLGRRIVRAVEHSVALARDPAAARTKLGNAVVHAWDAAAGPPPAEAFEGVDAVIDLVGESVDARWTPEKKRQIRDSRVLGTRHVVEALAGLAVRPAALVSASAVGFYGDRGEETLDETSSAGTGFLSELCVEWEREAVAARALGMRVACARTGLVLAADGGALPQMLTPFRLGLGGRMGSGQQWMPWIHVDDVVSLLIHAARCPEVDGPFNVAAPNPLRNIEFTKALGAALRRPTLFAVPSAALRAVYGERVAPVFTSQRAFPRVAERTGFSYAHPAIGPALTSLVAERRA